MSLVVPHFDFSTLEPGVVLWPVLFGLGAYLVLTAQPIGRPKPDLAERLRRLDVDAWLRGEFDRPDRPPIFTSQVLEGLLRPVLDDVGRLLQSLLPRLGGAGGTETARMLALVLPGTDLAQFYGQKAGAGLIGLLLVPTLDLLGIYPFGPWPLWVAVAIGVICFLIPDWELDRRTARRRLQTLMELPAILDLLTLACSSGLSLEQALHEVARPDHGIMEGELYRVVREAAMGQRPLLAALEAMAERNGVPALTSVVSQLRMAADQGLPLAESLAVQADSLREQKRLRIIAEGGRASTLMIVPVVVFLLPVLFVVLLVPAAVELLHVVG